MAETQHTPGPWRLGADGKTVLCDMAPQYHGVTVAVVQQQGMGRQAHANARLIAAAPDMLAALLDVAEYLGDPPDAPGYASTQHAVVCALIRNVRAAIAKAGGRAALSATEPR